MTARFTPFEHGISLYEYLNMSFLWVFHEKVKFERILHKVPPLWSKKISHFISMGITELSFSIAGTAPTEFKA